MTTPSAPVLWRGSSRSNIKKPLADEILFGHLRNGGTVRVLLDREKR